MMRKRERLRKNCLMKVQRTAGNIKLAEGSKRVRELEQ
jgi:hypothetical protein